MGEQDFEEICQPGGCEVDVGVRRVFGLGWGLVERGEMEMRVSTMLVRLESFRDLVVMECRGEGVCNMVLGGVNCGTAVRGNFTKPCTVFRNTNLPELYVCMPFGLVKIKYDTKRDGKAELVLAVSMKRLGTTHTPIFFLELSFM